MSMYTLLRNNPSPTQEEMEQAFEGNLCRCTGYRPILDGYRTFCSDCKCKGGGEKGEESKGDDHKLFDATKFKPYDPSQDIIFPPGLKVHYDSNILLLHYSYYGRLTIGHQCLLKLKLMMCPGTGQYHSRNFLN